MIVRDLLDNNRCLLTMTDNINQTPLHQAMTRNRLEIAKILLEDGL